MTGQKGATTPQLDPDSLELAPGTEHQNLEGWAPVLGSDAEVLDANDILASVRGTSNILVLDTDLMGRVGTVELSPGVEQTAYGVFSDVIDIAKTL